MVQMCFDVDVNSAISTCTCDRHFRPDTEGMAHGMPHDLICQLCHLPVRSECKIDLMLNHSIILTETYVSAYRIRCCHSLR